MERILFKAEVAGIEFTFERRPCRKTITGQFTFACNSATFVGGTHYGAYSRRVSLCKHLLEGFDVEAWKQDRYTLQYVARIWENAHEKIRKATLYYDARPRPGDHVYEEHTRGVITYTVRIAGLTREQAIHIYKMADAIIGEESYGREGGLDGKQKARRADQKLHRPGAGRDAPLR